MLQRVLNAMNLRKGEWDQKKEMLLNIAKIRGRPAQEALSENSHCQKKNRTQEKGETTNTRRGGATHMVTGGEVKGRD